MHVLALHFGDPELCRPGPYVDNCEIVRQRHRELVDRWLVLVAGRELRKVPAHRCRALEDRGRGVDPLPELDAGSCQPLSVCRDARTEAASLGERRRGRAGRGEAPCLINTGQLLRKTLRPTTRKRGVVVNENIGAVIYRQTVEDRLDQRKRLAVLIPGGVGQFIVGTGELPVEEPEEG